MPQETAGSPVLTSRVRSWWVRARWFAPAFAAALLFRARFFFTPLTADEGGFLAVARWWGRGAHLYRDVWVDRPQGLLLLFRVLDAVGLGRPNGIRLLALLFCLLGSAACGRIAARLVGPSAAWMGALAVATLTSIPRLEGFIANGELLSGAVGALSLATVLRAVWGRSEPHYGWLATGGLMAGVAVSLKQSGFDAAAAALVAIIIMIAKGSWSARSKRMAPVAFIGGAVVPVLLMMVHGAATGWHNWWFEVVRYRSATRSVFRGAEWSGLRTTGRIAAPILLFAVLVVLFAVARFGRRQDRRVWLLVAAWCVLAGLAFLSGGQYFRHYWIILMFPLGVAVGVCCATAERRSGGYWLLALALLGPTVFAARDSVADRALMGQRLSNDKRLEASERIADWFDANARPGDRIYAMCAGGALYGNLSVDPPLKYVWFLDIRNVQGAVGELLAMLEDQQAPRFVAVFDPFENCDPSGRVGAVMEARYRQVEQIGEYGIWVLQE